MNIKNNGIYVLTKQCRHLIRVASYLCLMSSITHAIAEEDDDAPMMEEVIIYGDDRREMNLQDYAGTAVSFSGEELDMGGIINITDLAENVPGLEIGNAQGNLEVWVRGIGSSNNTELGDPAAAFHFDDVYIPRPAGIGSAFFDIERVQVNVGPQGTIRGRNAMAGSINAIPWKPGIDMWNVALEAEVGAYDQRVFRGVLNVPLIDSKLAGRLSLYKLDHDSYYNDVGPNDIGVAEKEDNVGGRLQFLYLPTDKVTMHFAYDYLLERGTGYTGTNYAQLLGNGIDPDSVDDPRDVYARGFEPILNNPHWGVKLQFTYAFDNADLEYTFGYRDLVYDYQAATPLTADYPGAVADLQPIEEALDNWSRFHSITDSESEIHELRLVSSSDRKLQYIGGIFYFRENQYSFLGSTGDRGGFFQGNEFNQPNTDTESYSVYTDLTWNFSDETRFTVGLRYTDDHKDRQGVNAQYRFALGALDTDTGDLFGCCLGARFGTEGFAFSERDRKLFNPEFIPNPTLDPAITALNEREFLDFFFDGIQSFGERDNLDDILANGTTAEGAPNPDCIDTDSDDNLIVVGGECSFIGVINPETSITIQDGEINDSFIDWRLRAEHDINDEFLTYGLIATGHKSGGFNDSFPEQTRPETYETEKVTLYELGFKNTFDLGSVPTQLNGSVFYNDYTNQVFCNVVSTAQAAEFSLNGIPGPGSGPTGDFVSLGVNFCFNAGESEIYGSQFDGKFFFPWDITLSWKALWLQAEFLDGTEPTLDARFQADVNADAARVVDITGNTLPRTPEYQLSMSLGQAFDLPTGRLDYLLSIGWRDEQFLTIYNGREYRFEGVPPLSDIDRRRIDDKVSAYATVDFGVGYNHGDSNLRFEAYVNNLTNEQQPTAILITQFDNTRFFTRPRIYGFRVKWQM